MPTIGSPQVHNPFNKIKMDTTPSLAKQSKQQNVGEVLNQVAGRTDGPMYVDGNKHNQLGKNEFMKMLTHQLANQDPMQPMDQKKMAADLAQFAQLEQLTNMNTTLKESHKNDMAQMKFVAASFLGREAITEGMTIQHTGTRGDIDIPIYLPQNAKKLIVRINDGNHGMIKQIEMDEVPKGNRTITWNGVAADNTVAAKGPYTVSVHGWDETMTPFNGQTKSSGLVTSVYFENDETVLELDGQKKVFLRDVERFKLPRHNEVDRVVDLSKQMNNVAKAYQQAGETEFGR